MSSCTQAPSVQQNNGGPQSLSSVFTLIQVAPSGQNADDAASDTVTQVRQAQASQAATAATVSNGLDHDTNNVSVNGSLADVAAETSSSTAAESRPRSLWQSAMRGAVAASSDANDTRWQRTISKVIPFFINAGVLCVAIHVLLVRLSV